MDYGKYRYEQKKREKEAKKKQKIIHVKEVRLSPSIESHDLFVKASHASKFLDDGDKVKVSLRFRGRERGRTQKGFEVMERFADTVKDSGLPEKRAAFEGRNLVMILAPLPEKERRVNVKPKAADEAAPAQASNPAPAADEAAPTQAPSPAPVADEAAPAQASNPAPAADEAAPTQAPSPAPAVAEENANNAGDANGEESSD
jgi:translation initiation factor IF-3